MLSRLFRRQPLPDALFLNSGTLASACRGLVLRTPTLSGLRQQPAGAPHRRAFLIDKHMPTGIVKWFDLGIGYGLIQPDSGDREVLVHISAVRKAGLGSLSKGARLSYELVNRLGKPSAHHLQAWTTNGFAANAPLNGTSLVEEEAKPQIGIRLNGTERSQAREQ